MNRLRTPRNRNLAFLARCVALLLATFGLAASFTASLFGQAFARPDGSVPVPIDWSSRQVVFTGDYTPEQALKTWNEPRAYAQWLLHGNATEGSGPLRWRPSAKANTAKTFKRAHEKGLGHLAWRRRCCTRHVARQVLLRRERAAELHRRFRSIPRQRIDAETRAPMLSAPSQANRRLARLRQ